jgi:NAD(P)-dependent dehydrogenase (short-subunit alcohol dehydrogenase family)
MARCGQRAEVLWMRRFDDRVVAVTGAAGAIGTAICSRLADEGATVIRCDRAGDCEARFDVSGETGWAALAADVAARHGRLDVLVNAAGLLAVGAAEATEVATWQTMLAMNLTGAFLGCRAMLPLLRKARAGNVVNIASVVGLRGNPALVGYSAAKGGMLAMTRALAIDHAPEGLRFNAVCPGTIEGPMAERYLTGRPEAASQRAASIARHPMGRFGKPMEVAAAVAFLASDDASFITGIALPVDGGRSVR